MPPRGVLDLKHKVPSVTLEIGALMIVLVERDSELAVIEVDGPVQVLHLEEDLFDTDEPHFGPPSPAFHESGTSRSQRSHSMTWSARSSSDGGIVRPSALAVLRLITSANFVGCSTGRSAGLAPLRILST